MTDGDRYLIAMTVILEAESEGPLGQEGVARVIRNRMEQWRENASTTCLRHFQFSSWNDKEPRRLALSRLFLTAAWSESLAAVDAAFGPGPDPTHGALFYLREDATRAGRADHSLPSWFHEDKVTARIGHHTFLVA